MSTDPQLRVIEGGRSPEDRGAVLRRFYDEHAPSVYGRCLYLLKNESDAEDAMQEVFAKALTNLVRFRGEASPLTWLLKIATHHCLNEIRGRRAGWREAFRRQAQVTARTTGGDAVMADRDRVRRSLMRHDVETQRAVVHYHLDGMTLEEVAGLLQRSVPTIRKRLKAFAAALEKDDA